MAILAADLVAEAVNAPSGGAAFSISATAAWNGGYRTFASIPGITTGSQVYYSARDSFGNSEVGIGTYASGALTRTAIITSNNSNNAANFIGTVTVANVQTAESVLTIGGTFKAGLLLEAQSPATIDATAGTTLLAANIVSRTIIRSGPTTAFTDTLDTAANIIGAIPNAQSGFGFELTISNTTSENDTLALPSGGGVSFVLTGAQTSTIQPQNSTRWWVGITNITSGEQSVTLTRISSGGI